MFHFEKNFGLFVGKLTDNKFHKHYALQISVSSSSTMKLSIKGESEILGNAFLVSSNVKHQLISNVSQLTILINPLSSIGHQLYLKFGQSNFSILEDHSLQNARITVKSYPNVNSALWLLEPLLLSSQKSFALNEAPTISAINPACLSLQLMIVPSKSNTNTV